MNQVIDTEKLPIKMWTDDIDDIALEQAKNLANLPFIFKHVAIMPDAHCGYGMPIGGVIATSNTVIPNAVGVDIGCGMGFSTTNIKIDDISEQQIKDIMSEIRRKIPLGFNHHNEPQDCECMHNTEEIEECVNDSIVMQQYESAIKQVGTLGGGNHFIEIQQNINDSVCIMIHSGSRNVGYKVAQHYHKIAKNNCEKWCSNIPTLDLAFLPADTTDYKNYLLEMLWCVQFAENNRRLIMQNVKESFKDVLGDVRFLFNADVAHNYASMEDHFGTNVMVHRKGATRARFGSIGIIPGSQGTPSYIVKGKGNSESFRSCSHGAGRKMSRTRAKNELDLQEEKDKMKGIIHSVRNQSDLDEAPGSYKDISEVMKNQQDLVDIVYELIPLAVIKG